MTAARFVEGEEREVIDAQAPVRERPSPDAPLMTEALMGERVTVYEFDDEGWAWGQLAGDGYVGWLPANALMAPRAAPTHKVDGAAHARVSRSLDQAAAGRDAAARQPRRGDARAGPLRGLAAGLHPARPPRAARRNARRISSRWRSASSARRICGAARPIYGLDCSGLVQVALGACGIPCPRDSDMQEHALGTTIDIAQARRGDLVFWKGHVAIVRDGANVIHANAFHMAVAVEPIATRLRASRRRAVT